MRLINALSAAAIACAALTTTATAGGLAVTVIEPTEVIEVTQPRSSWGIILPILAVAILIALASGGDDDTGTGTGDL